MQMKKIFASTIFFSVILFSEALYAADWGPCKIAFDGPPFDYNFDISQSIQEPTENKTGKILTSTWNLGTKYSAYCECPSVNPDAGKPTLFKADVNLQSGHATDYFKVNDFLDVTTKVYVVSYGNWQTPFTDLSNRTTGKECDPDHPGTGWATGSRGELKLYIVKPFVGQLDIPKTEVVAIFGTKQAGVYYSTPLSTVNIFGNITVTQGCELAAGTTLEIPFGEYQAHDFKGRAGQPPQGVRKIQKELSFDCNNISDGVKIYLSIEGTPNTDYPSAISLGNSDVGAVIEDGKGNILKPNDSNSLLEMAAGSLYDTVKRTAKTTITAYPVSTNGKLPAAGDYSGIATMHVELE
ncbi:long polar fimbrial protein LpfD [Escherichia coli]|nr:long polar fimbrial protein LpfD [Escherichia coli]EKO4420268.1 long polar fimbrial protein LpfD [Escherichia coli]EKQ3386392.1 long polar fimbrial protein LpfD [Escherichia coli]EKS0983254.1 long polar fimbrial protein LpfD [Escherichia coli]ELO4887409.1 long polar fimbrial protein LpfD [Escherichia coli]